jgi:tetratricopeptide (TPR) repeat protein
MKSYLLTKDPRYLQAGLQAIQVVSLTLKEYGTFLSFSGNPEDRTYFYPDDHCDLDFYRSRVSARNLERDPTAYYLSAVDRILRHDPRASDRLLAPPTHPRHQWLVEKAPIEDHPKAASRPVHPAVASYRHGAQAEKEGRYRDAIAIWESVLQRWPSSSPELYRQIGLWQKLGEPSKALETCHRFIQAFPHHSRVPSVKMWIAEQVIREGRADDAANLLERLRREHPGAWAEEASIRSWHELGVGQRPETAILVSWGSTPALTPIEVLEQYDGSVSNTSLQVGAAVDENSLYLRLEMPWSSDVQSEEMILFLDSRGEMTDYLTFSIDSSGKLQERGLSWHRRRQPLEEGRGWAAEVTRSRDHWTAHIVIPFEKIGFRPSLGRRAWRFGFRWRTPRGDRFWRPSLPEVTRPQDCGWLVFGATVSKSGSRN